MPYNKGDFTQQGVNGHVNATVRLNEKRLVNIDLTSNEESEGCTITGTVKDLLNNKVYAIGSVPTGKINITSLDEVNVTDYATAQVVDRNLTTDNIKKDVEILGITGTLESGGTTWTTVAAEQSGTTVFNSGVNLYFLQLSNVTDFGSPVIKVTHDNNVYYCFWDIINKCWRDTAGTIIVAATTVGGVAYWGVAKSSDTEITTHTAKIEADTSYSILVDEYGSGHVWFFNSDIGNTIPSTVSLPQAVYGCTISTYGGVKIITFTSAYAVISEGVQ